MNLIRKLWDDERFVNDNTLTVNVTRLRQKLAGDWSWRCSCDEKRAWLYGNYIVEMGYLYVYWLRKRYEKLDTPFHRFDWIYRCYFMA